jgi:hypothetical protein
MVVGHLPWQPVDGCGTPLCTSDLSGAITTKSWTKAHINYMSVCNIYKSAGRIVMKLDTNNCARCLIVRYTLTTTTSQDKLYTYDARASRDLLDNRSETTDNSKTYLCWLWQYYWQQHNILVLVVTVLLTTAQHTCVGSDSTTDNSKTYLCWLWQYYWQQHNILALVVTVLLTTVKHTCVGCDSTTDNSTTYLCWLWQYYWQQYNILVLAVIVLLTTAQYTCVGCDSTTDNSKI